MIFDPGLFGVSKKDIGRCILNNSSYACNTESGCKTMTKFVPVNEQAGLI